MGQGDFDDLLVGIGLGRWNTLYFVLLGLCGFMIPCFVFAGGFIAPSMKFECVAQSVNETITFQDECSYTIYDNETSSNETNIKKSCSEWTYKDEDFSDTLTSEFDLVCENLYLRPMYTTMYMIGNLIGSPLNGYLSDRYGRKTLLVVSSAICIGSVIIETLFKHFTAILVTRFFTGISTSPLLQTWYILCMEVCPPVHRTAIGILLALPWAFGTMWWGFLGYTIRDWRWLMRATTLPAIIYFSCFPLLDESPRWMIVTSQHEKALKAIKKAARWNSSPLPSDQELRKQMRDIHNRASGVLESQINLNDLSSWKNALKKLVNQIVILYKTPEIRKRSILMYMVFFASAAVYYGLSLNAVNFKLDPFVYMVVGGLTEIPAYTLPVPIVKKFGRVPPTAACYIVCGTVILALAFIPSDIKWLVITFAMVGRLCISISYQLIYLIVTEIFPTEVRMQGMGSSAFVGAVGGAATPFITELIGDYSSWLPSVIFSLLALLGGVAAIFIPETLNKHLPETIFQLETGIKNKNEGSTNEESEALEKA